MNYASTLTGASITTDHFYNSNNMNDKKLHDKKSLKPVPNGENALTSKNDIGDDDYADFKTWDIGDIVGLSGNLFSHLLNLTLSSLNSLGYCQ